MKQNKSQNPKQAKHELSDESLNARLQKGSELTTKETERLLSKLEVQNEELRRAQAELENMRDRYRDLFDWAPVGYITMDSEFRIRQANFTAARLVGKERQTLSGKRLESLVINEDHDRCYLHLRDVKATQKKQSSELRVLGPNATPVWVMLETEVVSPQPSPSGDVYRVALLDIHQRKLVEEELENIFNLSLDMLGIASIQENRWKRVNPAMTTILGWSSEELLNISMSEFVHPDDMAAATHALEALAGGEPLAQYEQRLRCKDGSYKWIAWNVAPYRAREEIICVGRDTTDRRRARQALQDSEQRYRTLFESIDEAFCIIELIFDSQNNPVDYCITETNPAFVKQTGLKSAEGKRISDVLPHLERHWINLYGNVALSGEPNRYVEYMEQGDRWFEGFAFPLSDDAPNRVGVLFTDITARKAAEEALREFNKTLEHRVAERTAQVEQQAEQLRALAAQLARTEQNERKRLAQILHDNVQQLISAARLQVGWIEHDSSNQGVPQTAKDVYHILGEALNDLRSLAIDLSPPVLHEEGLIPALRWLISRIEEHHHFRVHLYAESQAEPASEELRALLFDCGRELLFNAVKHSGATFADVALLRPQPQRIELIVKDTGTGFDPDVIENRTAEDVTFGLFSIEQRLSHIGGSMYINTAPDTGTQVTLSVPDAGTPVPALEVADTMKEQHISDTVQYERKTGLCRVLIVDDHQIMREGLASLFRFEPDMEVVGQAADGKEAVALTEQLHPDVILMDVNLGEGMTGLDATKRILSTFPETTIIGLSMHVDEQVAEAMRHAGAVAYLTKDNLSQDLLATIRQCHSD